ncbi:MAG: protein kinase domain-containing protein [Christensenellales bacterium]|jgi:beta-lactam-binding protein with PASTA domain/tRNA A-37 threonylcarbamoyl transferase component Bud32
MSLLGQVLNGKYKVLELLAQGGMSFIYKAERLLDGETVAIKMLRDEFLEDDAALKRFDAEAEAAMSVSHPNVVKVYGYEQDSGRGFIVMECVEGNTLKELISYMGRLPYERAIKIAIEIAGALECAHKKGIIHRDIKPHNILITNSGTAKLTDFGIAGGRKSKSRQAGGAVLGSVHYFAPEQARGERTDEKTDIYSLGIVLYEMVTGETPYRGDKAVTVAIKHLHEEPTCPNELCKDIPAGLCEVILKAIKKNPASRYAQASDMIYDLKTVLRRPEGGIVSDAFQDTGPAMLPSLDEEKKGGGKTAIVVILAATLVIALIAVAFILAVSPFDRSGDAASEIHMPEVVGSELAYAEAMLRNMGFNVLIEHDTSEEYEAGLIMAQTPAPLEPLERGSEIMIVVSDGLPGLTMPRLIDFTEERARLELNYIGVHVNVTYRTASGAHGYVLEQSPAPGEILLDGQEVSLVVSIEGSMEQVPDVAGLPLNSAIISIRAAGLTPGIIFEEEGATGEGVIRTLPEEGEMTLDTKPVQIWIPKRQNKSYSASATAIITLPESGGRVRVTVSESDGLEYLDMESEYPGGVREIEIEAKSATEGYNKVNIYVDGELVKSEMLRFLGG